MPWPGCGCPKIRGRDGLRPYCRQQNYKGSRYTDAAAWEYYDRSRDHYILHPETRKQLETCLLILRDKGEDACFAHIRKELLGKKK